MLFSVRWASGNTYLGDWKDGVADGHGEFRYRDGGSRDGERWSK